MPDLYKALGGGVPIGLVASDWGGQRVECFSSPDALNDKTCGGTIEPKNEEMVSSGGLYNGINLVKRRRLPGNTQLWYGQIYPFLPMRFTGATWLVENFCGNERIWWGIVDVKTYIHTHAHSWRSTNANK